MSSLTKDRPVSLSDPLALTHSTHLHDTTWPWSPSHSGLIASDVTLAICSSTDGISGTSEIGKGAGALDLTGENRAGRARWALEGKFGWSPLARTPVPVATTETPSPCRSDTEGRSASGAGDTLPLRFGLDSFDAWREWFGWSNISAISALSEADATLSGDPISSSSGLCSSSSEAGLLSAGEDERSSAVSASFGADMVGK